MNYNSLDIIEDMLTILNNTILKSEQDNYSKENINVSTINKLKKIRLKLIKHFYNEGIQI